MARAFAVSSATLYRWLNAHPRFASRFLPVGPQSSRSPRTPETAKLVEADATSNVIVALPLRALLLRTFLVALTGQH
jgi:transposase-like protein